MSITGEKVLFINTDIDILNRMLENLIKNCITHANGNINIEINNNNNGELIITNKISSDNNLDVNKLFNKFYKTNNNTTSSGLGLYIVKILSNSINCDVKAYLNNNLLNITIYF